ncbi:MAG: hypothetical protein WD200_01000 [Candidatus Andersenbacteria bacterium]
MALGQEQVNKAELSKGQNSRGGSSHHLSPKTSGMAGNNPKDRLALARNIQQQPVVEAKAAAGKWAGRALGAYLLPGVGGLPGGMIGEKVGRMSTPKQILLFGLLGVYALIQPLIPIVILLIMVVLIVSSIA